MSKNLIICQSTVENDCFVQNSLQLVGRAGRTPANRESWKIDHVGSGCYELAINKKLRSTTIIAPYQMHPYILLYHKVVQSESCRGCEPIVGDSV